ncbi:LysR family transcriptional regulator [Cereibacter sphaeroides]|nr:Transcriptional regulator [Cereibacter sphaeroides KD131]EKX56108.1 LysR family transcriptional regulator YbhD [Rhodobacter sp. AKP1]RHZ92717.1 LysR family transcriptional regulator [Cereibacter sphaeroides]
MSINFELLDLRTFLAIIDLGSFRKAAEALNISQPALTRRMQAFEYKLGNQLFERSTRNVSLTNVGREIEPMARRTLAEIDEQFGSLSDAGATRSGFISIACIPTSTLSFLPSVIGRFQTDFPRARFRILDNSSAQVLDSVFDGTADFGLTFTGQSDSQFKFTALFEDEFVALCAPGDPIAQKARIAWSELNTLPLIGVNRSSGNRTLMDTRLSKDGIKLNWAHEVNHVIAAVGLVRQAVGVSVVPRMAYDPRLMGDLRIIPLVNPVVSRRLGILERSGARQGRLVTAFLDLLKTFGGAEV